MSGKVYGTAATATLMEEKPSTEGAESALSGQWT